MVLGVVEVRFWRPCAVISVTNSMMDVEVGLKVGVMQIFGRSIHPNSNLAVLAANRPVFYMGKAGAQMQRMEVVAECSGLTFACLKTEHTTDCATTLCLQTAKAMQTMEFDVSVKK